MLPVAALIREAERAMTNPTRALAKFGEEGEEQESREIPVLSPVESIRWRLRLPGPKIRTSTPRTKDQFAGTPWTWGICVW
jgi:hypothetical protein